MRRLVVALLLVLAAPVAAGEDTLVFANGNTIVGEIQSMDRGVLQIETGYSDSDFQIEWTHVVGIRTTTFFEIALSDTDRRYYGRLTSTDDSHVTILTSDGRLHRTTVETIVYLGSIEDSFWDRIFASIDIGYSVTKAQNLQQFSSHSTLGYRAPKWQLDASFDALHSRQVDVEPIERNDSKLKYRHNLWRGWYSGATLSESSNTEQKLDMRLTGQVGMGKYFARTNSSYFGAGLGLNRNVERYSNDTPDRNSWEAYLGTDWNLYDVGDLNFLINITVYQGLTEASRFRSSSNLNLKYDLPYDFYISINYSLDTDNKPAEEASKYDYAFSTGFGWEW